MKKKMFFFTVNESKNFVHLVVHFMKWTVDFLSISQNGQFYTWVVTYMYIKFSHICKLQNLPKMHERVYVIIIITL